MKPKDLLAIVTSADEQGTLAAAEELSRRWGAHAAILHLTELPAFTGGEAFGAGLWIEVVAQARELNAPEHARLLKSAARFEPPAEVRRAEVIAGDSERIAGLHALHADLAIIQHIRSEIGIAALEGALFKSGRPLLVVPDDWRSGPIGRRILVAWQPKREAARAISDARAFLAESEHVSIVTVDSKSTADAGVNISRHLARHQLDVELRQVDGLGRDTGEALLDQARAMEADLIVMGGFGHSRMREFLLGGVTRTMLETSPIPVLMSH